MRKIILQMNLSLDGFTAGPNGELEWLVHDMQEAWEFLFAHYGTVDTVLLGRVLYEGYFAYWPARATNPASSKTDIDCSRWLDATPKIVFSQTLNKVEWQNSRLVKGNIIEEIQNLKGQPGNDILIMNSVSLAHTLLPLGLIDEYWLTIHPVVIGSGKPLFENITDKFYLKLLNTKAFSSGHVFLHYQTQHAS